MEIIFFVIAIILASTRRSSSSYNRYGSVFDVNRGTSEFDPILIIMVFVLVVTFIFNPIFGVILIPVCILGYRKLKSAEVKSGATKRRKEALLRARVFLLPYKDIWKNLTLSNKYCSLKLRSDGKTIVGTEKKSDPYLPYRTFRITATQVFDYNELWNLFCINFSYNKSYDGLLEDCEKYKISIYEDIVTPELPKQTVNSSVIELTDINNCSEAELTALPGISIVVSKKIIKKREEIGGFKNVDEFLIFINLKPNVTKQLKPKICVNKMKGSLKVTRNSERTLDL